MSQVPLRHPVPGTRTGNGWTRASRKGLPRAPAARDRRKTRSMNIRLHLVISVFMAACILLGGPFRQESRGAEGFHGRRILILSTRSAEPYRSGAQEIFNELGARGLKPGKGLFLYFMDQWEGYRKAQLSRLIFEADPVAIISLGTPAAECAMDLGYPVIFMLVLDPSELLSRSSHVTGVTMDVPIRARLHALKKVAPRIKRVGLLYERALEIRRMKEEASNLDMELVVYRLFDSKYIPDALDRFFRDGVQGLVMIPDPMLYQSVNNIYFLLLWGLRYKVAIAGLSQAYVRKGALVAVEPDYKEVSREVVEMALKVLRGSDPGKIPVRKPGRFSMSINLQTARRLGLTVPQEVLDEAQVLVR